MNIFLLIIFLLFTCLYMSWNIGSNDLANAMGTTIGSGSLNKKQVIILASIFEFIGAVSLGGRVATTIATDIIPLYKIYMQSEILLVYSMIASLLASSFLVTLATFYSLPISTSHSIVGSILGLGLSFVFRSYLTFSDIYWLKVISISLGWLLSPLFGALLSFMTYFIIKLFFLDNTYKNNTNIEKRFSFLQIFTACLISLSHGSNDVSNSIAPLKALILISGTTSIFYTRICSNKFGYSISFILAHHWNVIMLCIGGFGMILGFITYGHKVINTIGNDIIKLTPIKGFTSELSTAIIILFYSICSFPVSTTHVLVGSIIGIGIASNETNINIKILNKIFISWLITVPISSLFTIVIFNLIILYFKLGIIM